LEKPKNHFALAAQKSKNVKTSMKQLNKKDKKPSCISFL